MKEIELPRVTLTGIKKLQNIGRETFFETFYGETSEEIMAKYLKESFSLKKLAGEINDKNSEFYFALSGESIIGYLKLNFGQSQTVIKDDKAVEIERIYVLKSHQGKNVGQVLYEKALQIARQKNAEYIWLGVWEKNHRAINFYKKNGFVEHDKHIFRLGDDEQTDIIMKLNEILNV